MTPQQQATAVRILPAVVITLGVEVVLIYRQNWKLAGLVLLLFGLYAFAVELLAVRQGGQSTISDLAWLGFAAEPWVAWLLSVVISNIAGFVIAQFWDVKVLFLVVVTGIVMFIAGHLVAQHASVYARLRKGDE